LLLPFQHHVRRPTPVTTTFTPRQYRWRRFPRRDGSVARVALVFVALASSSSALVWGASIIFSCLFGEKIY
jgi:hypothetical protein